LWDKFEKLSKGVGYLFKDLAKTFLEEFFTCGLFLGFFCGGLTSGESWVLVVEGVGDECRYKWKLLVILEDGIDGEGKFRVFVLAVDDNFIWIILLGLLLLIKLEITQN
jgi:hypothetical protein